ncbi:MAG TPA: glycerol-3-phosphate acyltransferase, partial [Phycisphaerales bacterium]|nr:glycerol-3-phosphate acyltransferase [Phycisphaerales bacterium]
GVATGAGAMLAIWPLLTIPALAGLLTWFILVKTVRYISLASMSVACCIPFYYAALVFLHTRASSETRSFSVVALNASPLFFGTLAIALLIIYQHRSNISRLLQGTESRVGSNH